MSFLLQETRREDVGQVVGNKSMSVAMTRSCADGDATRRDVDWRHSTSHCILFGLPRYPFYIYHSYDLPFQLTTEEKLKVKVLFMQSYQSVDGVILFLSF